MSGLDAPRSLVREQILILPAGCDELCQHSDPEDMAASVGRLAAHYMQNIRRVARLGIANQCPDATPLDAFNLLLRSRHLEPLAMRDVPLASRLGQRLQGYLDEVTETAPRRGFLRAGQPDDTPEAHPTDALALFQQILADRPESRFAVTPRISAESCTGCGACLRICPQDVLSVEDLPQGGAAYMIRPAACDGCGLCVELCDMEAIKLSHLTAPPDPVALANWTCRACGAPAQAPIRSHTNGEAGRDGLCTICREAGHHRKLFQVIA